MLPLNLPSFTPKVKVKEGNRYLLDLLRRKYVAITPEEWVRQHFVNYLITEKQYPKELMANEVAIKLNKTTKRCDTVVYNSYLKPLVVIEYKAPSVEISANTFDQIVRYNMVLQVKYLMVSNGMAHFCCMIDYSTQTYRFLQEIPSFSDLLE